MFFDGSLNINGAGARILFISPNKDKLRYVLRILFPASNNVAEYEAGLHGIWLVVELSYRGFKNKTRVVICVPRKSTHITKE